MLIQFSGDCREGQKDGKSGKTRDLIVVNIKCCVCIDGAGPFLAALQDHATPRSLDWMILRQWFVLSTAKLTHEDYKLQGGISIDMYFLMRAT